MNGEQSEWVEAVRYTLWLVLTAVVYAEILVPVRLFEKFTEAQRSQPLIARCRDIQGMCEFRLSSTVRFRCSQYEYTAAVVH